MVAKEILSTQMSDSGNSSGSESRLVVPSVADVERARQQQASRKTFLFQPSSMREKEADKPNRPPSENNRPSTNSNNKSNSDNSSSSKRNNSIVENDQNDTTPVSTATRVLSFAGDATGTTTPSNNANFSVSTFAGSSPSRTVIAGSSPSRTVIAGSSNSLLVNKRQDGNPMLKHVRNVRWEFSTSITPDFIISSSGCALFLSLRYHLLYPGYIMERIQQLRQDFNLKVMLCLVDIDEPSKVLTEINVLCIITRFTLILAWSNEEVARYLETYKAYEYKPADAIKGRVHTDYMSVLSAALTSIPSVNKTDVITLASQFGSFKNIMEASQEEIMMCPGFGEKKAARVFEAFREPFINDKKRKTS